MRLAALITSGSRELADRAVIEAYASRKGHSVVEWFVGYEELVLAIHALETGKSGTDALVVVSCLDLFPSPRLPQGPTLEYIFVTADSLDRKTLLCVKEDIDTSSTEGLSRLKDACIDSESPVVLSSRSEATAVLYGWFEAPVLWLLPEVFEGNVRSTGVYCREFGRDDFVPDEDEIEQSIEATLRNIPDKEQFAIQAQGFANLEDGYLEELMPFPLLYLKINLWASNNALDKLWDLRARLPETYCAYAIDQQLCGTEIAIFRLVPDSVFVGFSLPSTAAADTPNELFALFSTWIYRYKARLFGLSGSRLLLDLSEATRLGLGKEFLDAVEREIPGSISLNHGNREELILIEAASFFR